MTEAPTTSTAPEAPPAGLGSLAGKVIVIDPGHNEGNSRHPEEVNKEVDVITRTRTCDTSGAATNDGYPEPRFTLDLSQRVRALLEAAGATVILTREETTPWGPCIPERAAIGNRANADAAISIHADGGPASGHGFHVIEPRVVPGHNEAIIDPSHRLALHVRGAYRDATGIPYADYIARDGLDSRDDLGGLNLSSVPKVFIECANMRSAIDAALIIDESSRDAMAAGIAHGLEQFVLGAPLPS